ncbi:hypothetical protein D1872_50960 [compost metagenome]
MNFYLDLSKARRKSVGRVDKAPNKQSKLEQQAENLGLENFLDDLTTKRVVRKGEEIEKLEKSINPNLIEYLAEKVHAAWRQLAPESHVNQVPYEKLSEAQKDKDRQTVKAILTQLEFLGLLNEEQNTIKALVIKKFNLEEHLAKADNSHLPKGAERCAYTPTTNYGVVYIPVNRLRQVYQTDEALNPAKVNENRRKIREDVPMDPVEIGYDYDVHDGHHRWHASIKEGCTHVPCKVVGTDPEKVKRARKKYTQVWKSLPSDLKPGLYIAEDALLKGMRDLDFSKLVRKPVQVRGKDGKVFTRMQWVDPHDASTGHGVRKIESMQDMKEAKYHGLLDHPQVMEALKQQGLDEHGMRNHDFKNHPPFYLPETKESADNGKYNSNHYKHGHRIRGHKVHGEHDLLAKQDELSKLTENKLKDAHSSKEVWSNYKPEHIDRHKLMSGQSIIDTFKDKIDSFVGKNSQAEPDFESNVAGGNIYKHVNDLLKGTTVEGLEHVFSNPEGAYSSKLESFELSYEPELKAVAVHFGMSLRNRDGQKIGTVNRSVARADHPDALYNGIVVENKLFEVDEEEQGNGIGKNVYERSEDYWKHLADGQDVHICTYANISVGTYAWATKGFDFEEGKGDVEQKRHDLVQFLKAHELDPDDIIKRAGYNSVEDIKTAKEFADLDCRYTFRLKNHGAEPDSADDAKYRKWFAQHNEDLPDIRDEMVHLGKAFMLIGTGGWSGYKRIPGN